MKGGMEGRGRGERGEGGGRRGEVRGQTVESQRFYSVNKGIVVSIISMVSLDSKVSLSILLRRAGTDDKK